MITVETRPFEFAGFIEVLKQISPLLNSPTTVEIDFSACKFFGPSGMVPLISLIDRYTNHGWDFRLTLPEDERLAEYWESAGWIAAIAGDEPPPMRSHTTYTPLASYTDHRELNAHLNEIMDVLAKIPDLSMGVLTGVEWALNEIADNVLVHAEGARGWIQTIARLKGAHKVDLVVADCGPGILATIREGFPDVSSDTLALRKAIEKGVTRNKTIGQGNGLAGSVRIAESAQGWVNILSGTANLRVFNDGRRDDLPTLPYPGTCVSLTLPTDHPIDISEALWGHTAMSMFENTHLTHEGLLFALLEEATGFGNRGSGAELANKLRNIATEFPGERIAIDFLGIDVASASFLDEFLAKMILSEGVTTFFGKFELRNMNDFVKRTADAVIAQRLSGD